VNEEHELNISEIYLSIQGEGSRAGQLCVFVRLQGCELRCTWCDTPYALDIKSGGTKMKSNEIFEKIKSFGIDFIEFTGGEPLLQKSIIPFISQLLDYGYNVAIETNGHADIGAVDRRAVKIMDIKCPGSGMVKFNNPDNIEHLLPHDEVKFVIADRNDYDWAREYVSGHKLTDKVADVIFSPVFGSIKAKELAEWIISDRLAVRMQLQMHKFIWEPDARGV
jgi:7-carboxy-7-deazaguanine synthase